MLALHAHQIQFAKREVGNEFGCSCINDNVDAVLLRQALEPRAQVHGVAHDRIGNAKLGPHVADIHVTARDADSNPDRRPALGRELIVEAPDGFQHVERR